MAETDWIDDMSALRRRLERVAEKGTWRERNELVRRLIQAQGSLISRLKNGYGGSEGGRS